jgi:hypothetical protein
LGLFAASLGVFLSGQLYRTISAAVVFFLGTALIGVSSAQSNAASVTPSLDTIVIRLREAADQNRLRWSSYRLLRQYQMFRERNTTPMAEVKAELVYDPNGNNGYQILESKGSDHGSKVVSKLLDSEANGWSKCSRPHPPTAISRDNYDFTFLGTEFLDGHPTYVLGLHPLRKDSGLIDGKAWVDTQTYLIHKIVGEESKSPSWWVRNVNLTLTFGSIGGMWLQTTSQAVADIRIVGQYTMIGRALGVKAAEMASASNASEPER